MILLVTWDDELLVVMVLQIHTRSLHPVHRQVRVGTLAQIIELDGRRTVERRAADHQTDCPLDILAVEMDSVAALERTFDHQRRKLVVACGGTLCPHLAHRVEQRRNRSIADLIVTGDDALSFEHAGQRCQKIETRAGVAHIQNGARHLQPLEAGARNDPLLVVGSIHRRTEAAAAFCDVIVIQVQHRILNAGRALGQRAENQAARRLALGAGDFDVAFKRFGGMNKVIHDSILLLQSVA